MCGINIIQEQDPNGLKVGVPGAKFDDGKISVRVLKRMGLALMAVADLGTAGAKKYSFDGWVEVDNAVERYEDAMIGHMLKEAFETEDPDMRFPHEVQVAWNALTRLQKMIDKDPKWKARLLARRATDYKG